MRGTPVVLSPRYDGFWVVSGHSEVAQASRTEATFTSELAERDGVVYRDIAGVPRVRVSRPPGSPKPGRHPSGSPPGC